jgi:hypothetical protein
MVCSNAQPCRDLNLAVRARGSRPFGSRSLRPAINKAPSGLSNPSLLCYIVCMASKTATRNKRRRTTVVPVTTMEEIPVLSGKERAQLTTSLREGEARVRAGKAIDYDPKTFKDRLVAIYRGGKR